MKMLGYTNNFQQVTNHSKSYEIWGFAPQHMSLGSQLPLPVSSEGTAGISLEGAAVRAGVGQIPHSATQGCPFAPGAEFLLLTHP